MKREALTLQFARFSIYCISTFEIEILLSGGPSILSNFEFGQLAHELSSASSDTETFLATDHELTISWLLWREIDTSWPKVSDCLINNSSCPNLSSCLISHGCVCLLYTAWCLLVTCISMKYPLFMMTIDFIMSWDEYKLVL
jgi:hypothetical protein